MNYYVDLGHIIEIAYFGSQINARGTRCKAPRSTVYAHRMRTRHVDANPVKAVITEFKVTNVEGRSKNTELS